jgi:hypothetical protein
VLAGASELAQNMASLGVALRGVVVNRVHPLPGVEREAVARVLAESLPTAGDVRALEWLRSTWTVAVETHLEERARLAAFARTVPQETPWVEVPELEHDAHCLADLAGLVGALSGTSP